MSAIVDAHDVGEHGRLVRADDTTHDDGVLDRRRLRPHGRPDVPALYLQAGRSGYVPIVVPDVLGRVRRSGRHTWMLGVHL